MIEAYFVRDSDADGGYFAVGTYPPIMSEQRLTVIEVRKGQFPEATLNGIFAGSVEPSATSFYDEYIIPYYDNATVWWTREGGYVNGTE